MRQLAKPQSRLELLPLGSRSNAQDAAISRKQAQWSGNRCRGSGASAKVGNRIDAGRGRYHCEVFRCSEDYDGETLIVKKLNLDIARARLLG